MVCSQEAMVDKLRSNDILNYNFYKRNTSIVAKELLGKILVKTKYNKTIGGVIVETEAYYGMDDPASHASRGLTPRAKIMFGRPGIAYVYLCYGMYYLLNVVTETKGNPGAVLIRAVEPIYGINIMAGKRGIKEKEKLANGPGKLTIALGVNSSDNGKDFTKIKSKLCIYNNKILNRDINISVSKRIGITNGRDKQLRYFIKDSKFVSNH